MGCLLAILGSTVMVIHAPKEENVNGLVELGTMMMMPGFLAYTCIALSISLFLIFKGQTSLIRKSFNKKFLGYKVVQAFSFAVLE